MRLILLTAALLALGSAASANTDPSGAKPDFPATPSNIKMATNEGSNAAGGTGVEESADSKGVTNKQGNDPPGAGLNTKAARASKLALRAKVLPTSPPKIRVRLWARIRVSHPETYPAALA